MLGLKRDEYRFDKPEVGKAVEIYFHKRAVALEDPPEDYNPLELMMEMMGGNVTPRCSSCLILVEVRGGIQQGREVWRHIMVLPPQRFHIFRSVEFLTGAL